MKFEAYRVELICYALYQTKLFRNEGIVYLNSSPV